MSARVEFPASEARAVRAIQLQPLSLMSPDDVQDALQLGGMYPPSDFTRMGTSGLQWRNGCDMESLMQSALDCLHGAQSIANDLHCNPPDEHTERAMAGQLMLLRLAGGALGLVFAALGRVEVSPSGNGAQS